MWRTTKGFMSDNALTIEQVHEGTRTGALRWRRTAYGNSVELVVDGERLVLQADPPRLFRRTVTGWMSCTATRSRRSWPP